LEEALEEAKKNVKPMPPEKQPKDLPEQRHEHAVIAPAPTETPNIVPGGFPMKP
jgi:hypothetical protein